VTSRLPYSTHMFVNERDGQATGNHVLLLDVLTVVVRSFVPVNIARRELQVHQHPVVRHRGTGAVRMSAY
jgi:hypothetical protein